MGTGGRLRAALWGAGALFAGGCSLLVDTGGLAGPAEASDAAAERLEIDHEGGTETDAAGDVSPEGGPVIDASVDAAQDGRPGCGAHPLCDDFDLAALGARWTSSLLYQATVALDATHAQSLPNSLFATSNADASAGRAYLFKSLKQSTAAVTCAFNLYFDAAASGRTDVLWLMFTGSDYYEYSLRLVLGVAASALNEVGAARDGGGVDEGRPLPNVHENEWVAVRVRAALPPSGGGSVTISYNGGDVAVYALSSPAAPVLTEVALGMVYTQVAPVRVRFDDLVCDY
jgi:hypothetical protein